MASTAFSDSHLINEQRKKRKIAKIYGGTGHYWLTKQSKFMRNPRGGDTLNGFTQPFSLAPT
ncbi:MAG: hypothetical protein QXM13_01845 [Candidatus Bathyarchaeia archaeon]